MQERTPTQGGHVGSLQVHGYRSNHTLTTQRVIPPLEREYRLEPDEERDSSPRTAGLNNQPTHSGNQKCTGSRSRTVVKTMSIEIDEGSWACLVEGISKADDPSEE